MDAQMRIALSVSIEDEKLEPIQEVEEPVTARSSPRQVTPKPLRIPSISISVHDDSEIPVEQRSVISLISELCLNKASENFKDGIPEQRVRGASVMRQVPVKKHESEVVSIKPTSLPISQSFGSMVHVFTSPVPGKPESSLNKILEPQSGNAVSGVLDEPDVKINLSRGHKLIITLADESEDPGTSPHNGIADGSIESDSSSEGSEFCQSGELDIGRNDEVKTFIQYERLPEIQSSTPANNSFEYRARMFMEDEIEVLGQEDYTNQSSSNQNQQSRASLFARCFTCTLYEEEEFDQGSPFRIDNSLPTTFSVAEKSAAEQFKED